MAISARGMSITGIEDRRYWNWIPTEESRYYTLTLLDLNLKLNFRRSTSRCQDHCNTWFV